MSYITGTTIETEARSILCATEMARLIRKHRKLGVHLRDYDGNSYAFTRLSAKEALELLDCGQLDKLAWEASDDDVSVPGRLAPEHLALAREQVRLLKKLPLFEAAIARYTGRPEMERSLQWAREDDRKTRARLASIERRLGDLRAHPVAA
jgi:hypothetical protein